ncbi:hypothetical protein HPB50_013453 [Hyalomma asiaticum]|uniref:Uncharacterized protein n=1 Tax=Hyalomma asiaticum TaxID=266040 RepID=A0ACB7RYS4_HYAAI|nr:hypothetical protein HPB50_013453 [Hyalomma asiaticum]
MPYKQAAVPPSQLPQHTAQLHQPPVAALQLNPWYFSRTFSHQTGHSGALTSHDDDDDFNEVDPDMEDRPREPNLPKPVVIHGVDKSVTEGNAVMPEPDGVSVSTPAMTLPPKVTTTTEVYTRVVKEIMCTVGHTAVMPNMYPPEGLCQYLYYTDVVIVDGEIRASLIQNSWQLFQMKATTYQTIKAGIAFDYRYISLVKIYGVRQELDRLAQQNIQNYGLLNVITKPGELNATVEALKPVIEAFKDVQGDDADKRTVIAIGSLSYEYAFMNEYKEIFENVVNTFNADAVVAISSVSTMESSDTCFAAPPNVLVSPTPKFPSFETHWPLVRANATYASMKPLVGLSFEMATMFYVLEDEAPSLNEGAYAKCKGFGMTSRDAICGEKAGTASSDQLLNDPYVIYGTFLDDATQKRVAFAEYFTSGRDKVRWQETAIRMSCYFCFKQCRGVSLPLRDQGSSLRLAAVILALIVFLGTLSLVVVLATGSLQNAREVVCTVGHTAVADAMYPPEKICQYLFYTDVVIVDGRVQASLDQNSWNHFQRKALNYSDVRMGVAFDHRYITSDLINDARDVLDSIAMNHIRDYGLLNIVRKPHELTGVVWSMKTVVEALKDLQGSDPDRRTVIAVGSYDYSGQSFVNEYDYIIREIVETFKADIVIAISSVSSMEDEDKCFAAPPNVLSTVKERFPSMETHWRFIQNSTTYSNSKTLVGVSLEMATLMYVLKQDASNLMDALYARCRGFTLTSRDAFFLARRDYGRIRHRAALMLFNVHLGDVRKKCGADAFNLVKWVCQEFRGAKECG